MDRVKLNVHPLMRITVIIRLCIRSAIVRHVSARTSRDVYFEGCWLDECPNYRMCALT
jgi:hypothetical protein